MLLSLVLLALVLAPAASLAQDRSTPTLSICALDGSGSAARALARARALCAEVIKRAAPGDFVLVLWISDRSYASESVVAAARLQRPPCTPDPYDLRCKRQLRAFRQAAQQQVDSLVRVVLEAQPPRSARTDIVGLLARVARYRSEVPQVAQTVVYLTGDLQDNTNRQARVDLRSVRVVLLDVESDGNAGHAQELLDGWITRLRGWGASSIEFQGPFGVQ